MSTVTNGQIRKTLASQLDRLDGILDTLGEGLNEAVATVVQETVAVAVQAAVTEVLTNPELQQRLRALRSPRTSSNPIAEAAKSLWSCFKGVLQASISKVTTWLGNAWAKTIAFLSGFKATVADKAVDASGKIKAVGKGLWMRTLLALTLARRMRKALLVAMAAGITVGLGCYLSGPVVSSLVSGVAGFVGSLATGTTNRLRRVLAFLVPSDT
jgi:hypothetical protein